ncbi:MAG TPA: glycosyltransferase family A protein, partial [archaeon]|nr:glycosyltransferase family A protein [archaeon]
MISVIVPAYNSEKTIDSCIKSLLNQSFPKKQYEIIIVDDGSSDKTAEVASKYCVRLFKRPHKGPAAARNFGAKHARGNILLFTDSDCVPDKRWIKLMTEPFKDEQIVGVSGAYRT